MPGILQESHHEAGRQTERRAIAVRGIVQGVGFRPFVYSLANRYGLAGSVCNDAQGVQVEVEGSPQILDLFLEGIRSQAPPLAVVDEVTWKPLEAQGGRGFRIEESRDGAERRALISPDVATCAECLAELFDPRNRRYRYPFLNCTNCGPRFTITRSVPYDRAMTTMTAFEMCDACRSEYDDPADRRFHAQPNACFDCGPQVRLIDKTGAEVRPAASHIDLIMCAAELLRAGAIVAVKGLGGYHLACDPFNRDVVSALRNRKVRQDKPFALMASDLRQASTLCEIGPDQERLLASPQRPVVLLDRRTDVDGYPTIAFDVAPRQRTLGIMLAYSPLHHLLLNDAGMPLVMTSGNRHDEPIAYRDEEVMEQLGEIADYILLHDRPIHMRCDDTVVRVIGTRPYPIRRSRGYAPSPLKVSHGFYRQILACGGELKNTFCITKERHAFVSHHIGDLENYETLRSFREGIEHYCRLFDVQPELVAYDLHPDYLSTTYARDLEEAGLSAYGVQHHHAHIAACLADNERSPSENVIGVAMDGTGYGTDGAIWGGEFLDGSIQDGFIRRAHLAYAPLAGGKSAITQPWRMAMAQLLTLYGQDEVLALPLGMVRESGERNVRLIAQLLESESSAPWSAPPTSSAGRLFDTVAALCGLPGTQRTSYEGQAAIELELAAAGCTSRSYPFRIDQREGVWVIQTREILAGIVDDLLAGTAIGDISSTFHRTMASLIRDCCVQMREYSGSSGVALSGGTFQNALLLEQTVSLLEQSDFVVYRHWRVPPNDGGISLGQAVLADSAFKSERLERYG